MAVHAGLGVATLVVTTGIFGLVGPEAAASPAADRAALAHITGTAGNAGQLVCGVTTRTKGLSGSIGMTLNRAPAGQLLVRLQNAKNGQFFGQPKMINQGKQTTTLVSDVLAGTQFHVCAASPNGSPGGPYAADLSY